MRDSASRPWDVLVVLGGDLTASEGEALRDYVQGGGAVLLIPSTGGFAPPVVDTFLKPLSIELGAPRFETLSESEFVTFAWLDFSHPVFQQFREPTYSDFSMVRFNNFFPLTVPENTGASVLARFDSADDAIEYPAMLSLPVDSGQVVLWTFPLASDWTNLTRTRRFVPMLHESIVLLLPTLPSERLWMAGGVASVPADQDIASVLLPKSTTPISLDEAHGKLERLGGAGFVQWYGDEGVRALSEAISLDRRESDLAVYSPEEFRLRAGAFAPMTLTGREENPQPIGDKKNHIVEPGIAGGA